MTRGEIYRKLVEIQQTESAVRNSFSSLISSMQQGLSDAAALNDQDVIITDTVVMVAGRYADMPTPAPFLNLKVSVKGKELQAIDAVIKNDQLYFDLAVRPAKPVVGTLYLEDAQEGPTTVSYSHTGVINDVRVLLEAFPELAEKATEFSSKVEKWGVILAQLKGIELP